MLVETLILARITCYTATGNPMANGQYPKPYQVATSDRTIPFGSIAQIDGKDYTVGDRTALWVQREHGFTIDVYFESKDECKKFGRKYKIIKLIKKYAS